jgi:hypothetical protein
MCNLLPLVLLSDGAPLLRPNCPAGRYPHSSHHSNSLLLCSRYTFQIKITIVAEPELEAEPHNFGGVGAGAVTRCLAWIVIKKIVQTKQFSVHRTKNIRLYETFILFKNFGLLYSRVGAGAAGAASKFLPGAGAA